MYIGDRKEREEYMDNLERQMEDQREQIQRTLDRIEGSGRRRTVLERLRESLPGFPGRTPARGTGGAREDVPQSPEGPGPTPTTPTGAGGGQESVAGRRRWRFWR